MAIPKTPTKKPTRPLTAEVKQFMHFSREGDIIPHGWNKKIGVWHEATKRHKDDSKAWAKEKRKVWRSRPFAERLLARIVWFYTPSPIKDNSGKVTGWQRKFKAEYWQLNTSEMADALGCSSRTIRAEIALLKELKLVDTRPCRERTHADGKKNIPIFVIPIHANIVKLTEAEEESSLGAEEESSLEPRKNLPKSSFLPHSLPNNTESHLSGDDVAGGAISADEPTNAPENAQVEIQTLENSESEKGARVPPPAPARATAADIRRADDMIQVYAERKAGGKLQHWDIARNAIDAAIANRHHEDKAAITRACDSIGEIVATAANANGWHTYRSKKDLMQIIALDLPIDLIRTFIDADCTAIKSKQANRENYGTGDALQSVRIGMANMQKATEAKRGPVVMVDPSGDLVQIESNQVELALAQGYRRYE